VHFLYFLIAILRFYRGFHVIFHVFFVGSMLEELPVDDCFFVEDFVNEVVAASIVRVTEDSITNKVLNKTYTVCSTGGRAFCLDCGYALSAHRRKPVAPVVAAAPRTV